MRKLFILLLALLAIAAIAYFCIYKTRVPAIQADIASRAKAALESNGLSGIDVAVDGRDIHLTGVIDNPESKQLAERVAQVEGYNFIRNDLTVADSGLADAANKKYSLGITLSDSGKVTLDGILDSQSHRTLHQNAVKLYGKENVTDRILELDIPVAPGMPDIALLMLDKTRGLQPGEVRFVDQQIDIKGSAPSKALLAQIDQQIRKNIPQDYTLNMNLAAAGPGAADASGAAKPDNHAATAQPVAVLSRKNCQKELNKVLRRSKIRFNSGSAVISKSSYKALDRLVKVAHQCPGMKIKIHGHTDSTGRNRNNERLSKKRALAVANYLVKKGVPANNLVAVGHGASKPVASNKTAKGRARNRRIELTVERVKQ